MKSLNRREFIEKGMSSMISLIFSNHLCAGPNSPIREFSKGHLIAEIELLVKEDISKMLHFYHELLGFPVLRKTQQSCSFQAGASILSFRQSTNKKDGPFYHFAFNIPENKIQYAEEWQLNRSQLIKPPTHLTDEGKSTNIVHFRHWNAHSIFFYDPAGNVVEYIARHTLPIQAKGRFSTNDILHLSEIGLVVNNVKETYQTISAHYGLNQYSTSSDKFLAMGNEHGLLLLMGEGTKAAFNKGRDRKVYATTVSLNLKSNSKLKLENYPYFIG